jgi:RNA 3'-terminal phosphate cyclase (ATP)
MIEIDGSFGEGGGQVLRSSLTLAVLTRQPVQITKIRVGRSQPGLAAQHLAAVRAAAAICGANVSGDEIGSQWLHFAPASSVRSGEYSFDVAEMRKGGSAGSVSLVLQTVLLPLALASGSSHLTLRGGTHVAWSPSFAYLREVYLRTLARMGIEIEVELKDWGFYPVGGGEIVAQIEGQAKVRSLSLVERGPLQRIWGAAVVANLPSHIPQRMANRARNVLADADLSADIQAKRVRAKGPGAAIFVTTEDSFGTRAGFTAHGRKGLPAERVAEKASGHLLAYYDSRAALDMHLADQLILPMALAEETSRFTTCRVTGHLRTNMWVVEQFGLARFQTSGGTVTVTPTNPKQQPNGF